MNTKTIAMLIGLSLAGTVSAENSYDNGVAGDESTLDLAEAAQNPLAAMISVPFQNNTTFGAMDDDFINLLNVQPVVPFRLSEDWNLITRTILPIISQPSRSGGQNNGLGDTTVTGWLSPTKPVKNITWGVGPVAYIPTATRNSLGTDQWGGGVSAVAVYIDGPWVVGGLFNNVWGFDHQDELNTFLFQYFVNYNLSDGWYLVSAPVFTADWNAPSDSQWVVPMGGGLGKLLKIGKLPVNINAHLYYNVDKPDGYGDYTARVQVQFMFPK